MDTPVSARNRARVFSRIRRYLWANIGIKTDADDAEEG